MNPTPPPTSTRFAVSVMSRDRVGIVRDVTTAVAPLQANIDFVSQTVVQNYFTFILVLSFPQPLTVGQVRTALESAGARGELAISVMVSDATDRPPPPSTAATDRFILTAVGGDQPGIVHQLATYLGGKGVNITDLYGATTADGQFVVVSELAVPQALDLAQLQHELEALGQRIGLGVTLQHENIFHATNEVAAPSTFH